MRLVCNIARRCLARLTALAVVGALCSATAMAQGDDVAATQVPGTQASSVAPTLAALDQSVRQQDYTAVQVRRFVDEQGQITAVRERVEVSANGTAKPAFAVTFLGVEGSAAGSPLHLRWQQAYTRHGARLFSHGSFRVHEVGSANFNYSTHDFGAVVRAGRAARRVVVFPQSLDKSIWLVDLDDATSVPLYSAEFDTQLRLLAEVEVETFSDHVAAFAPQATAGTVVADFAAACTLMGNPSSVIDPVTSVTGEYLLDRTEVQNDPINGTWTMTMTYTDGIDQFVVVQSPATPDAFGALPGKAQGGTVIGRYRDPAMTVLVFWHDGVSFQVAGRGSLRRLDALARGIYLQALSSH